jgi:hypothetical protein
MRLAPPIHPSIDRSLSFAFEKLRSGWYTIELTRVLGAKRNAIDPVVVVSPAPIMRH